MTLPRKPSPKAEPDTDIILTHGPDGALYRFKAAATPHAPPKLIGKVGQIETDLAAYAAAGPLMYRLLGYIKPVLENMRDECDMDPERMKQAAKLDELISGLEYARKYCRKEA